MTFKMVSSLRMHVTDYLEWLARFHGPSIIPPSTCHKQ